MPQRKTVEKAQAQADASNASADVVHSRDAIIAAGGYVPARRTRTVYATPDQFPRLTPDDEAVPFWAKIADDLTFRELNRIPTSGPDASAERQMQAIAPWVTDWNAWGELDDDDGNPTGVWQPVPAPAVGGWEMLLSQTPKVTAFLVACLKYGVDLEIPKGLTSSTPTDSGESEPD